MPEFSSPCPDRRKISQLVGSRYKLNDAVLLYHSMHSVQSTQGSPPLFQDSDLPRPAMAHRSIRLCLRVVHLRVLSSNSHKLGVSSMLYDLPFIQAPVVHVINLPVIKESVD